MLVVLRSKTSLGTGGVLRNAADLVESLMSLVINGDSYIDVDLGAFLASHREWEADDSLVGAPADGRAHCGMSPLPKTARSASIKSSLEYISRRAPCFTAFSERQMSLETELFRRWLAEGRSISCARADASTSAHPSVIETHTTVCLPPRSKQERCDKGAACEGHDYGCRRLHRNGPLRSIARKPVARCLVSISVNRPATGPGMLSNFVTFATRPA